MCVKECPTKHFTFFTSVDKDDYICKYHVNINDSIFVSHWHFYVSAKLWAAEAIMFLLLSRCPDVPCLYRHFSVPGFHHEHWTDFDEVWRDNCYHKQMNALHFRTKYDRIFESTSNRCSCIVMTSQIYSTYRRAGESITHMQRQRHHMTARGFGSLVMYRWLVHRPTYAQEHIWITVWYAWSILYYTVSKNLGPFVFLEYC